MRASTVGSPDWSTLLDGNTSGSAHASSFASERPDVYMWVRAGQAPKHQLANLTILRLTLNNGDACMASAICQEQGSRSGKIIATSASLTSSYHSTPVH